MTLEILPVQGINEVGEGSDIAAVISEALAAAEIELEDDDILVVTHKIVSKAEGAVATIDSEASYRQLVETEAASILRRRDELTIAITRHGFICANAGVDRSNMPPGTAALLPRDPDRSARRLRTALERRHGVSLAVVITDTFGRPWRRGLVDVAIGVSGLPAILDLRGTPDTFGRLLEAAEIAVVDEIAAAADLVMGKASGVPAAIVRGLELPDGEGSIREVLRPPSEDLFR
ncbi:MAG: coenzyme F420-0:L-glutamate ligase [Acidimicrobiia bacterium]